VKPIVTRVPFVLALLLLLGFAWIGMSGGWSQLAQSPTMGQRIQSVAQLAYGLLSLVAIVVWFWARHWSGPVLIGWASSLALAGALAPVVWGESSVAVGVLSGVASLLIAGGIVWLLRFSARGAA
jgi:hypothetical protein